jgi:PAS domain S-box-containing protein
MFSLQHPPALLRYGSVVVVLIVATLLRLSLDPVLQESAPFATYYMAIMFTAWYGGLGPALLAIPFGALLADVLFIEPRGSILTGNPEHQVGLALYLCVGIFVAVLSESLHASRRRIEAALGQLTTGEEKFHTVADFTYDWEYWLGPDGNPIWTSPSCKRITGYTAEEFPAGSNFLEKIAHPDDRQSVLDHVRQAHDIREPLCLEFRIITRDGQMRWIEHVCQPVFDKQGNYQGRRANNRDATGKKQAEESVRLVQEQLLLAQQHRREQVEAELTKVKDQLIRQARLAAIGQVSASIVHDLRSPLSSFGHGVYLLKHHLPPDQPKCAEYLEMMGDEIELMNRIIGNLMEMAHGKQPQKEKNDLGEVTREVFARLEHGAIDLQAQLDPEPFVVAADPVQLRQVLGNLLANAIQAMGNEGHIRIKAIRSGNADTIVVEDDGSGIPAEVREQIFEPLVTSKPKGTGLGLTICRQILERHGGSIELLSTDKPGAAFQICLPSPELAVASVTR